MEQVEISVESRNIYVQMFDMCSISYPANLNVTFEFFPYALQLVTQWRWLWPVESALQGTVASGGWYTWSFIYPYRWESHGIRSRDLKGQGIGPACPIQAYCTSGAIFLL
jgi:hypothetical protein